MIYFSELLITLAYILINCKCYLRIYTYFYIPLKLIDYFLLVYRIKEKKKKKKRRTKMQIKSQITNTYSNRVKSVRELS